MYEVLDAASIPAYLQAIPAVAAVLGADSELTITEIGDGNLNFVFRVSRADDDSASVILKQAVPYLRMVGDEWPLGRDRMTFEIRALTLYNEIVPELVPHIHHADEAMSVLVMEFLDGQRILRQGMIEGITYPNVAAAIGAFMGETLFRTSALGMETIERRHLMDKFTLNAELCKLTEEFIFTFPYMEDDSNYSNPATDEWARANLRNNSAYKRDVVDFKRKFLSQTDALLHADLHTGSLMVSQDRSYVIDMEFAYFGPFGFDVGKIISNFLLACTSHFHLGGGADYRAWLLEQIKVIWDEFSAHFLGLWNAQDDSALLAAGQLDDDELAEYQTDFMVGLLQESIGFAACSMARRTLGIAGVADIRDIPDLATRSSLEIANLQLSMKLMEKHRDLHTVDDLLATVIEFYDHWQNSN